MMRWRGAAFLLVALAAVPLLADGQGRQARPGRREPAATATIGGRVLAGDTGVPLRRALVSAQGGGRPVVAQTDEDGRFELRVPPGRWSLAASKAGFVTLRLGQRGAFESVPPVEIGPGARMENADFVLPRGGAISGRVFDELGDPVLGAQVRVHRYAMVRGRKRLTRAGSGVTTDDRGAYRLYGLPPGQYYVSARTETRPLERGEDHDLKYTRTYFPGTADLADAQRVALGAGGEQTDVSFLLRPARTARVSGFVVDASGAPLEGGLVSLTTDFDALDGDIPGGAARVEPDGSFTIPDVLPGAYTFIARSRPGRRNGDSGRPRMAYARVVVPGDIADLIVTATTGATITGTIVDAGGGEPPRGDLGITAQPLNDAVGFGRLRANVLDDGTFSIDGLIGPVVLRPTELPAGWALARLEVNGMDVTDGYLELTGTEHALARMVLTSDVSEVSGRVAAALVPRSGHHVVLFPADPSTWIFPSRYLHTTRTGADGRFAVRGLPPHERYLAIAVDYLEEDEGSDPDFLHAVRGAATAFALREGERAVLELKLVER